MWDAAAAAGVSVSGGVTPATAKADVPGFSGGVGATVLLLLSAAAAAGGLSADVMPLALESVVGDGATSTSSST